MTASRHVGSCGVGRVGGPRPVRAGGSRVGGLPPAGGRAAGEVSAGDEDVVTAVVDPGPHRQAVRRGRWQVASSDLTGTLFAGTAGSPLDAVVRFALRAAAADLATFTAPLTARTGRVTATAGALAGRSGGIVDLDRTLAGRVVRSGRPVLIDAGAVGVDAAELADVPGGVGR